MKKEKGSRKKCQGTLKKGEKDVPREISKRLDTVRNKLPKLELIISFFIAFHARFIRQTRMVHGVWMLFF